MCLNYLVIYMYRCVSHMMTLGTIHMHNIIHVSIYCRSEILVLGDFCVINFRA